MRRPLMPAVKDSSEDLAGLDVQQLGECTKLGPGVVPALIAFSYATMESDILQAPTVYNKPQGPEKQQGMTDKPTDLAANVSAPSSKRNVTVIIDEIRRQAGHQPMTITPMPEQTTNEYKG